MRCNLLALRSAARAAADGTTSLAAAVRRFETGLCTATGLVNRQLL
jgi:hypothetical protein